MQAGYLWGSLFSSGHLGGEEVVVVRFKMRYTLILFE